MHHPFPHLQILHGGTHVLHSGPGNAAAMEFLHDSFTGKNKTSQNLTQYEAYAGFSVIVYFVFYTSDVALLSYF